MNQKSTSRAAARRLSPTLLASAITGTLLAAIAVPALASPTSDALQRYQQQRAEQSAAFGRDLQSVSLATTFGIPAASVGPNAVPNGPMMGEPGDLESWRSEEFKADWGLKAINADAAYARGLTGKGIRLGVFDSGTGLDHDEFVGKDHRSIHLADVLPDGSLCGNTTVVDGPDACFSSDGDQVAVDYQILDPAYAALLNRNGYYEGASYQIHGTHVSGTIAANRDGSGTHGVAFGADLSVARLFFNSVSYLSVVNIGGNLYLDSQNVAGIGASDSIYPQLYAQLNEQGVRAVNHSWGLATEPDSADMLDFYQSHPVFADALAAMAEGSRSRGLIQVWAAGNTDAANPSPEQAPIAGMYASLPRAIADIEQYWLAVVNVNQDSELSNSSMRCGLAANWCLAAPGSVIKSTVYGADSQIDADLYDEDGNLVLEINGQVPTSSYRDLSGTSMAAPHVTGALGLLFERFPYLSNAQVRDVLLTTATDLGAVGVDDVYGWGLLDLRKAIEGYGLLRVDTDVVMNQKAGGLKVWEGEAWDDWTNDIGGPGKLTKSGIGWLRLSGDNSFNGAVVREGVLELDGANALTASVDVQGGQFLLNGSLVSTTLNSLGGSSVISSTGVLDGSSLNVTGGSVTFNGLQQDADTTVGSGGSFVLNGRLVDSTLTSAGTTAVTAGGLLDGSDLFVSAGTVSFNGVQQDGSTVVGAKGTLKGVGTLGSTRVEGIIAPGNSIGTLTINGDYVQTASGIYQAELAPGSRSDLLRVTGTATLDGTLKALPEAGVYYLGEQFNFLQAAGGINGQFATTDFSAFSPFLKFSLGYSANGLRIDVARGNALASAAVTPNQIAVATSADGLAINQGLPRPLTQLFPAQVGAALDALSGEIHAATPMALVESSRYLRDAALSRAVGVRSPGAADEVAGGGAWVQAIGGSGKLDGDANAARTDSNSNGLLVGADHVFGGGWQVGGLVGTGRTDIKQAAGRGARSEIDNTHFGAYVGNQWGAFGLRAGLGYSRHDVDSKRQLTFAGYQDALSARYDATTRQGFIEGAYRFGGREGGLEPYLQFARVEVDMDGITEQGGAAALNGQVADTRTNVATAGVRFDKGLKTSWQQESWLHVRGGVGYRRASGDRSQVAELAWTGGSSFAVSGAAIADNAVVAELGLSAWLSPRNQLELGYNGTFGDDARDRSVTARWSVQF
ncbi:autotransporter serine protease [Stenotrophomonas sp. JAI102]|uniref:autotransporter domain-containing protein n=1 Tax=Stenotrophomonas sp. JAI102 TaxID=2723077 RepID=UPI0015CC9BC7|nr:autotransporter serine protease [Stenotrophomonas sp. JAI102]NYF36514.1 subtilase-type serine protease [Stenotrophomonas sp. JAI102]